MKELLNNDFTLKFLQYTKSSIIKLACQLEVVE